MRLPRTILVLTTSLAGCGPASEPPPEYPPLPDPDPVAIQNPDPGPDAPRLPPPDIQVVAGERSPIAGETPVLRIAAPRSGQVIRQGSVMVRVQLENWTLEPEGRHVHLIVDNEPYIAIRDVSAPLDLNTLVEQHLGHQLTPGTHVLRMFPSRGHHESVKQGQPFAMVVFHYGERSADFEFEPEAPLLTYSRPKGCTASGQRLLLDFYVANVELSSEGPHVYYAIDHTYVGNLTSWVPHYIENLPEGTHTIRLALVNPAGDVISGPFNDTTRTIRIGDCD